MGKYLFQLLLVFVFWSCVIWFGLPLLKKHATGPYNYLVDFFLADDKIEKMVSDVVTKAEKTFQSIAPSNAFSDTHSAVQTNNHSVSDRLVPEEQTETRAEPVQVLQPERNTETFENDSKTGGSGDTPDLPGMQEKTGIDDPLSALNQDPGTGWGIVVTNSYFYDADMKRIGIFLGGTVVSRKNSELKMYGYVSECYYLKERKWENETVFLYDADLVMFDNKYEEADVDQRNLLIKYCQTLAQLEEKRAEAYKTAIRKNPHFDAYKTVTNEYNEFSQRAKAVKAALDQSVGDQRTQLIDTLRRYKAEEAAVVRRYQETKKLYDSWKTEFIGSDKNPKITKTIEIQNLETTLQSMRHRVQEIVPGL